MKDLYEYFYNKAKINYKSKTKVSIEGRILDAGEFFTYCLDKHEPFAEFVKNNDFWKLTDKEKADWIRKFWPEYWNYERDLTVKDSDTFTGSEIDISDFELVVDYHTGRKVVFSNKLRSLSKMHPDAYAKALPLHIKKVIADKGMNLATFSFNPYNTFDKQIVELEGQKVTEFNCFIPPTWRCGKGGKLDLSLEEAYAEVEPPAIFVEFLNHLFPQTKHRSFVLNWMYNAIYSRNETYLVLNGKKGAGKNILCDLMGKLVGEDYYRKSNERFFDEGFNAVLDKARLVLLDEIKVEGAKQQNRLKNYINEKLNIEYKGENAVELKQTFNSYIINNNEISDMYLVWDDRRFSAPDITKEDLKELWGEKKINGFVKMFDDIEFQRSIGFWLKRFGRDEALGTIQCLKGERFWEIVHNSLTEWQKVIVDAILSRESGEYSVQDLKQVYKRRVDAGKFPFKIQKIGDFLATYRHRGKDKLGELDGSGENAVIIPSKKFIPFEEISTHTEEELESVL